MRCKGFFGTAALLAATRLSAAEPPPLPQTPPPAPFAHPAATVNMLPQAAAPPASSSAFPSPPSSAQDAQTPAPPAAAGIAQPQPQQPQNQTNAAASQAPTGFVDTHCGPPDHFWFAGGPLLAWIKNGPLPVLAVSSNGQALGGSSVDYGMFNGFEVDGGFWLDSRHTIGVSVGGFMLEQRSVFSGLNSDANGSPAIARPILDALTATQLNVFASEPGAFAGGVAYATSSRLWGSEANIVRNISYSQDLTVDIGFGFRYIDLEENLTVDQSTQALANGMLPLNGTSVPSVFLQDRFQTRNQFYGGQITTQGEYRFGPAFVDLVSKLALGTNHENVNITGSTSGGGMVLPGGLLAVGGSGMGNITRDTTNRFVVVPEIGADLGCQLTSHIRASVGYHFLYINDVVRPGSQIDPVINQKFVPLSGAFGSLSGPNSPRLTGQHDEFYTHGILFRLEVSY